jgi:hypothetical protein
MTATEDADREVTKQQLTDFRQRCHHLRRLLCDAEGQVALIERSLNRHPDGQDPRWEQYLDHFQSVIGGVRSALARLARTGISPDACQKIQDSVDKALERFQEILEELEDSCRVRTTKVMDAISWAFLHTDYAIAVIESTIRRHSSRRRGGDDG